MSEADYYKKWMNEYADKCGTLRVALQECLNLMEIQEGRMLGEFHITAYAFKPEWNAAKAKARDALGLRQP